MTDSEINKRLALAIGWKESDFQFPLAGSGFDDLYLPGELGFLCEFSYTDPEVIWPIAERFNMFPGKWKDSWDVCDEDFNEVSADTAAKAVALAVIKAKGAKGENHG